MLKRQITRTKHLMVNSLSDLVLLQLLLLLLLLLRTPSPWKDSVRGSENQVSGCREVIWLSLEVKGGISNHQAPRPFVFSISVSSRPSLLPPLNIPIRSMLT